MRLDRLTMLADKLDIVPPEHFDINVFVYHNKCGTVACAMGHAAMMPEFQALGLSLTYHSPPHLASIQFRRNGELYYDAVAAQHFFDLAGEQVKSLFFPTGYMHMHGRCHPNPQPGPKDVAAKIRRLVAGAAP